MFTVCHLCSFQQGTQEKRTPCKRCDAGKGNRKEKAQGALFFIYSEVEGGAGAQRQTRTEKCTV